MQYTRIHKKTPIYYNYKYVARSNASSIQPHTNTFTFTFTNIIYNWTYDTQQFSTASRTCLLIKWQNPSIYKWNNRTVVVFSSLLQSLRIVWGKCLLMKSFTCYVPTCVHAFDVSDNSDNSCGTWSKRTHKHTRHSSVWRDFPQDILRVAPDSIKSIGSFAANRPLCPSRSISY